MTIKEMNLWQIDHEGAAWGESSRTQFCLTVDGELFRRERINGSTKAWTQIPGSVDPSDPRAHTVVETYLYDTFPGQRFERLR